MRSRFNLGFACLTLLTLALSASASRAADSPLIAAAKAGNVAAATKLLAGGTDADTADSDNLTALNWAAYDGRLAVVKLLVEHGAKVNVQANKSGWTPLMNASAQGFAKVAAFLLEHGADINAHSKDGGYTALMYAARKGKKAVVLLLLAHDAKVNDICDDKRTALDFADTQNDKAIGAALIADGGKRHGNAEPASPSSMTTTQFLTTCAQDSDWCRMQVSIDAASAAWNTANSHVCAPAGLDTGVMKGAILDWMRAHPETASQTASSTMRAAMQALWPCR